jgi:branched-subunit amino acid transport protein
VKTWIAILAVGAVSYVFRAAPLFVLGRLRLSDRVDRVLRHAGTAALTALLVSSAQHASDAGSRPAILAATAIGLIEAARRASMLRVVLAGGATYAVLSLVWASPS